MTALLYAAARTDKRSPEKNQPVESGVGTNFGVGDRQGEARWNESGGAGVLGEGQSVPSPPARGLGSAVSSPSGVRGGAQTAEGFSCIMCRQIASLSLC